MDDGSDGNKFEMRFSCQIDAIYHPWRFNVPILNHKWENAQLPVLLKHFRNLQSSQ